jgi:hypothetical protein
VQNAGSPNLLSFPNDAAKDDFDGFLAFLNEGSQGVVDVRLVVPPASRVSLLAKPFEHVIVETNRDPGLAWR